MCFSLPAILSFSTVALLGCVSAAGSLENSKINALLTLEKEGFDAISTVNITQVLSLSGYALDGKNYSALQYVYTDDVVANVATSPIIGLPALVRFYTKTLGNIKTFRSSSSALVLPFILAMANLT